MRGSFVVVMALFACGKSDPPGSAGSAGSARSAPSCSDAVKKLAGDDTPERAALVAACERWSWSEDIRACVAATASASKIARCIEPALDDDKRKRPAVVAPAPSRQARELFGKQPIRALVIAAPDHTARAVQQYLTALGAKPELHDRFTEPEIAREHRVVQDTLVLLRTDDDRRYTISLDGDAERVIEQLDDNMQRALERLGRKKRNVYVVKGHGEIVDYASVPPEARGKLAERRTSSLGKQLALFDLDVKDLLAGELGKGVPADATVVLLLGPATTLPQPEQDALVAYLDRGGSVLVAYEPDGARGLPALDGRLGIRFAKAGTLADPVTFYPNKRDKTDRHLALTMQFSAHPSTLTLSKAVGKGLLLMRAGAFDEIPFEPATGDAPNRTVVIRSMPSAFVDIDEDYELDDSEGPPSKRAIAVAVEGPASRPFRAFAIADADVFADIAVAGAAGRNMVTMLGGPLLDDTMRWLSRMDAISGIAPEPARDPKRDVVRALVTLANSRPIDREMAKRRLEQAIERAK